MMNSNIVHRTEENGINLLTLSGRVISDIFYSRKRTEVKGVVSYTAQCTFVLLNIRDEKKHPFKIVCSDNTMVHYIRKLATKGCRIVLQGHLESKRRPMADVKKLKLERYVTYICMTQVVNIFDTKREHDNRFEYMLEQGKIISDINNNIYPNLKDFDSEY